MVRTAVASIEHTAAAAPSGQPAGRPRSLAAATADPVANSPTDAPAPAPTTGAEAPTSKDLPECCRLLTSLNFTSELPVIIIQTAASNVTAAAREQAMVCTCSWGEAGVKDYQGNGKIKVRGNSSAKLDKKGYSLRLADEDFKDKDAPFLGMPSFYNWALYATDPQDLTEGLRNYVAYHAFRETGRYGARTRYAEVFLATDGEDLTLDTYAGLYLVEEHNDVGENRIDIKKWKASEPSGGFVIVYDNDNFDSEELLTEVITGFEFPFVVKYPDGDTKGPQGAAWMTAYLEEVRATLYSANWTDASSGYASYLDVGSWVDYFLHTELAKNPDGYRGSTYLHKDRNGPLVAGPPWDFNEAFGECCGFPFEGYEDNGASEPGLAGGTAISADGWRFLICADQDRCIFDPTDGMSMWYRRLWNDTAFRIAASDRWAELRTDAWADRFFEDIFEEVPPRIEAAVYRDLTRWEDSLRMDYYTSAEEQWTKETAQLRKWILARLAWMDEALALAGSPSYVYPSTGAGLGLALGPFQEHGAAAGPRTATEAAPKAAPKAT